MTSIKLEILLSSHLEHFKAEKDMAMFLPLDHPRRKVVKEESDKILNQIHKLKKWQ